MIVKSMSISLSSQINSIELAEQKLKFKKMRTLEKAFKSDNPNDMLKASTVLSAIQQKSELDTKSFMIDPLQFNSSLGFKDKPYSLSYTSLKRMSKTPIINAIIKTRKNQIADFAEPQADRYSTGFVVRKKSKHGQASKMDDRDKKTANAITDFILNCGSENSWEFDDFDAFIRKIVDDSLTYDQMTFELTRNRRGQLVQFMAVDGSTFRMSDSSFVKDLGNPYFARNGDVWNGKREDFGDKIKGYYPNFVQVYQNVKVNEFYPWELCFGVRNPSTSIYSNGYGVSELEELINVITSMLWGDEYNRRFFSQGSAPKGLLRVKGNVNEASLQQFKQQWQAMISGVMQSWKTPVVEADVDWIDLQKNNRDMEYTAWMEYLIKLACAVYSIDPSEIGWDISKTTGTGGLGSTNNDDRIQNSKDKGLYPLLKFIQRKMNKYVVEQINPEYEFAFVGLNGTTIQEELDMDIKKAKSFVTINETRDKWELKPIEHGDIIEDSVYAQQLAADRQQELNKQNQQGGGMGMNSNGEEKPKEKPKGKEKPKKSENPFDLFADEAENEDDSEKGENNLFVKAFDNFLKQEENGK